MVPEGCPETDAFRGCILECVWKQADAKDYFVKPVRKYACAVFGQEFITQLDLVLILVLALGCPDAG
jgi:hypothetical protein